MDCDGLDVSRLIRQARGEQSERVDQLLGAYRNYLGLLARTWIDASLQGKADPSDLVQETLIKAHERFGQFQGSTEAELIGWLRQILTRCLIDFARRWKGAAARQIDRERSMHDTIGSASQALGGLLATSGASPSKAAEGREMSVILADAMAELSDDHREVILLREIEGMDWDEIAGRMKRSKAAVGMLWTRALRRMKTLIEERL